MVAPLQLEAAGDQAAANALVYLGLYGDDACLGLVVYDTVGALWRRCMVCAGPVASTRAGVAGSVTCWYNSCSESFKQVAGSQVGGDILGDRRDPGEGGVARRRVAASDRQQLGQRPRGDVRRGQAVAAASALASACQSDALFFPGMLFPQRAMPVSYSWRGKGSDYF